MAKVTFRIPDNLKKDLFSASKNKKISASDFMRKSLIININKSRVNK